jgi:hypothetical protein
VEAELNPERCDAPVKNTALMEEDYRFVQHFFRVIEGKATGVLLSQHTLQSMTTGATLQ